MHLLTRSFVSDLENGNNYYHKQSLSTLNHEVPIYQLPSEVLQHILAYITEPKDQKNVLLACKQFSIVGLDDGAFGKDIFTHKNLMAAIKVNSLEAFKFLLRDKRVDPSAKRNKAIIEASSKGCVEIIKLLLKDQRIDPSEDNNTALVRACANGHATVVEELMKNPAVKKLFFKNERVEGNSTYFDFAEEPINAAFKNQDLAVILALFIPPQYEGERHTRVRNLEIHDYMFFFTRKTDVYVHNTTLTVTIKI